MNTSTLEIAAHYLHSSYREKLVEHLFVGLLLRRLWCRNRERVECLRPEVDSGGYDLVFRRGSVTRFVQLKSSHRSAKTRSQKVNSALATTQGGCVIWISFDELSLELGPFGFFGGEPAQNLPSIKSFRIATHTKHNKAGVRSERPNIRLVPRSSFKKCATIDHLILLLFGPQDQLAS